MATPAPRILVVDDDAAIADFVALVLTRAGYEVVVTTQSPQACAIFQAAPTPVPCC